MNISTKKKQQLKQEAHHLKPVILIGIKGLTDAVHNEIAAALKAHELVKISVREHEKEDIDIMSEQICGLHEAQRIQRVGHTITVWRKRKE
jgi:RNA-binding protein